MITSKTVTYACLVLAASWSSLASPWAIRQSNVVSYATQYAVVRFTNTEDRAEYVDGFNYGFYSVLREQALSTCFSQDMSTSTPFGVGANDAWTLQSRIPTNSTLGRVSLLDYGYVLHQTNGIYTGYRTSSIQVIADDADLWRLYLSAPARVVGELKAGTKVYVHGYLSPRNTNVSFNFSGHSFPHEFIAIECISMEPQQSLPPVSGTRGTSAAYAPVAPGIPER